MGIRSIVVEENCPPVKVSVWVRVRVSFRVREQFSSGAIVLEPKSCSFSIYLTTEIKKLSENTQKYYFHYFYICAVYTPLLDRVKFVFGQGW